MIRNAYPCFYKGRSLSLSSRGGCRCRSLEPGGARVESAGGPSASATVMEDNSPGGYFGDVNQRVDRR